MLLIRQALSYGSQGLAAIVALLILSAAAFASSAVASAEGDVLTIDDAPEMNVIAFGKTVVIKKRVKEVFSWGGDVIVEGSVEGDVAALGGSVIQNEGGHIGGTVIVIGGTYRPESNQPLRGTQSETIVFGMFEEEFREIAQNPSSIFAPAVTPSLIIQRILSALFWFVVTIAFVTLAPGSVSRAIARFNLSSLKVVGIGAGVLFLTTFLSVAGLQVLPDYLGALVTLMAIVLLMLAYGFGRIVLHVSLGKLIQAKLFAHGKHSESIAVILGVVAWTLLLSIPYVWTLAVLTLFAAGIGLVLTVRSKADWKM